MDARVLNSMEAITNLIYLAQLTLHEPETASVYLKMAETRLAALSAHLDGKPDPQSN